MLTAKNISENILIFFLYCSIHFLSDHKNLSIFPVNLSSTMFQKLHFTARSNMLQLNPHTSTNFYILQNNSNVLPAILALLILFP